MKNLSYKVNTLRAILREMPVMVVIDAGHGRDTLGKRSPNYLGLPIFYEYDYNRKIAAQLKRMLFDMGIESHLLVPHCEDVSLPLRCEMANRISRNYRNRGYFVFGVSIHGNAGGGTGFEIYTSPGDTPADPLATVFFETASDILKHTPLSKMRSDYSDGDPDKESPFYILKHTSFPMLLTETGFYDNASDLAYMRTAECVRTVAELHAEATYRAIVQTFKNKIA